MWNLISRKNYILFQPFLARGGFKNFKVVACFSAGCVIAAGIDGGFSWLYWLGIVVFAGMFIYQHSLVKPDDLSKVNIAFMTANGIASVVFGILVIADLLLF